MVMPGLPKVIESAAFPHGRLAPVIPAGEPQNPNRKWTKPLGDWWREPHGGLTVGQGISRVASSTREKESHSLLDVANSIYDNSHTIPYLIVPHAGKRGKWGKQYGRPMERVLWDLGQVARLRSAECTSIFLAWRFNEYFIDSNGMYWN